MEEHEKMFSTWLSLWKASCAGLEGHDDYDADTDVGKYSRLSGDWHELYYWIVTHRMMIFWWCWQSEVRLAAQQATFMLESGQQTLRTVATRLKFSTLLRFACPTLCVEDWLNRCICERECHANDFRWSVAL